MISITYPHITLNDHGVAILDGTTMKVVELILDSIAYGWSPEELRFQHPYLSMGQVYSALAYYWDHKQALDQDIERRLTVIDDLARELPVVRLDERLRAQGLL